MRRASEVAEAVLVVVPVEGVVAVGVVVSLSLLLLREVSRGPVGGGLGAVVDSLVESVAVGATAAGGSGQKWRRWWGWRRYWRELWTVWRRCCCCPMGELASLAVGWGCGGTELGTLVAVAARWESAFARARAQAPVLEQMTVPALAVEAVQREPE